jgi:asparaginyl-tRNA synthetase
VRTFRNNQFIALNDGSTIDNIQCVVDFENTTGATSVGTLVEEVKVLDKIEIQVAKLEPEIQMQRNSDTTKKQTELRFLA